MLYKCIHNCILWFKFNKRTSRVHKIYLNTGDTSYTRSNIYPLRFHIAACHIYVKNTRNRRCLIKNFISVYYIPYHRIMDQESAYMSSPMNYSFKNYNYQSVQTEHVVQSLFTIFKILTKHLTCLEKNVALILTINNISLWYIL